MGTFRSLYTQQPCERCGRARRMEIQFKTGEAIGSDRQERDRQERDHGERYDVGDRVYDLEPGTVFPGVAEHFCFTCMYEYHLAENEARHAVAARFVESGRLVVTDLCTGAPMTVAAILDRGKFQGALIRRAALERSRVGSDGWPRQSRGIIWKGEALDRKQFTSPAQLNFLVAMRAAVDIWMLEHGWRDGQDWLREDLSVWIDERGIIGFTIPEE